LKSKHHVLNELTLTKMMINEEGKAPYEVKFTVLTRIF
jgi:hypothetical protein